MSQASIDALIQQFYTEIDEDSRLTDLSAAGRVEFERMQSLLRERLSPASRVLDIGGATGIHAAWLADDGHEVTLIDPVGSQVERAARIGTFTAQVGDARQLDFADDSFDAALLLGPLYHLRAVEDRLAALREATRVVRPGGMVFAAAITRFSAVGSDLLAGSEEPASIRELRLINDGDWDGSGFFPAAHFHTSLELEGELRQVKLSAVESVCVEGPMGLTLEFVAPGDEELHQAALLAAERLSATPGAKECGPHLLAWGIVAD